MPIEDAKKRELVAGITAILRQSPLNATIDTQRLAMAFSMVLDNVEPGQPIDLQHLYQWLVSQKASEKDALELCVVLKLREDKLGAPFIAPAKAQYMDQVVLDDLAGRFQTKAERSQGWDKKAPEPLPPAPGERKPDGWRPKKGGKGKSHRVYPILLSLAVLSAIGFWSWRVSIAVEPMRPIVLVDASGLKCDEVVANDRLAICRISRQAYAAESVESLRTRTDITLQEARKQRGTAMIYVMVENRLKMRRP